MSLHDISHKKPDLGPLGDRLEIAALANVGEAAGSLVDESLYWGYYTTPDTARFLRHTWAGWRETLATARLQEARIFDRLVDVRWSGDRGVRLGLDQGGGEPGGALAGEGWLQADRRSRLWGEWLAGTRTWYEGRIPDPLCYEGLEGGDHERFVFLIYREYIRAGTVHYSRLLDVEGSNR